MGIAFHQTDVNIKIAKKHGGEIAKLLLEQGWITGDMPFEAALATIGWHGKVHKSVLEIEEIDVDKMTDRVRRQLEALAPFVRDGGLVRFESEESSKDYALCVFEGGQAHGYGWLATPEKSAAAAAMGPAPSGPWNEYIHDETPSREKLADHRYWAVVAWMLAQRIWFIAQSTKSFGAKDWDLAKWIICACEEAQTALRGERYLSTQDITMHRQGVPEALQRLAANAQENRLRWLKTPRKKLAELPIAIEADGLQALLQHGGTFAPGRDLVVGGQEGVFQPEVLSFFEHLRKAPWYAQISRLTQDSPESDALLDSFHGLMAEMLGTAGLKEALVFLHRMTYSKAAGTAYTPGVDTVDIPDRAARIHRAMARIGQLAATA